MGRNQFVSTNCGRSFAIMHAYLDFTAPVRAALDAQQPVVALESTIISHGMPYPENLVTAQAVEEIIRAHGAVPATIAIIDGRIQIGLTPAQMEFFATAQNIVKASRRDLPVILAQKLHASTTVAATMICAQLAGIEVFVTGGIGGVHREADKTFDISADLQELAHTDVAVVCAAAKAILDVQLTLEYLETFGVPVLGYQTDEFPAFYTRASGLSVNYRVNTPAALAEIIRLKWSLGLHGGLLIANPIPAADALPPEVMNAAIQTALHEAKQRGVTGKDVTPFLLDQMKQLTGGDSLTSNIALIKNNACLGAEIAVALRAVPAV